MATQAVKVGAIAAQDPIMSAASTMAAAIALRIARASPTRKRIVFTREMNKVYPGLAVKAAAEYDQLIKTGRNETQALFDAIRLVIANWIAERTEQNIKAQTGLSGGGLGLSMQELQQGFCTFGAGGSALVGGYVETFTSGAMPGGALVGASGAAANIGGCNTGAMQNQAATAQQQLAAAAQIAAAQQAAAAQRTQQMLIVGGLGLGATIVLVLLLK